MHLVLAVRRDQVVGRLPDTLNARAGPEDRVRAQEVLVPAGFARLADLLARQGFPKRSPGSPFMRASLPRPNADVL